MNVLYLLGETLKKHCKTCINKQTQHNLSGFYYRCS